MTDVAGSDTVTNPVERFRSVVWGRTDPRVRATWRVLLAMPILWTFSGAVLAGNVQAAVEVIPSGRAPGGGLAQSLLHGGFFLITLLGWARYLDREPLSNYGVSVSLGWLRDFVIGFAAVIVGFGVWIGLGAVLGETTVVVSPTIPQGSVFFGFVIPVVALVLHAAVQQVVFFRVILKNAAEGLHSRGVSAVPAAIGAVPVAVLLFIVMHGELTILRVLDLAVAGSIFGLLYVHTGELAMGIGAHFGALYAGIVVSAVIRVTGSLPGVLGLINQYGFPKIVVAYLMVVAWLIWWHGEISTQNGIAWWTGD